MTDKQIVRSIARSIVFELIIYSLLVGLYFFLVLRYLSGWLFELFQNNLTVYALIGLGLILIQGAFLDQVTSFLLNRLRLDRLE
jgi:hypothetical protein